MVNSERMQTTDILKGVDSLTSKRELIDDRGDVLSKMVKAFAYSGNRKLFQVTDKVLTTLAVPQMADRNPFFRIPKPEEIKKEGIFIGYILHRNKRAGALKVSEESIAMHKLIVGISGSGKSTLIKNILPQLVEKGITVITFDSENEYQSLLKVMDPSKILIIDPKDDRENLLQPPKDCPPKKWLAKLKDLFREVFYLRDGSMNLLSELLNTLYTRAGVYAENSTFPALHDLVNLLNSKTFKAWSRIGGYHESLVNRFQGLEENLGETLCCEKGYDLSQEHGKLIIYRVGSLSAAIRNFYINLKLLKEKTYREHLPPQGLKTVFVVEETHKLYNVQLAKRCDLGEPLIFDSSRTFRKRGIGFIYSDQIASDLPSSLSGNVNIHIIFRIVNGRCIHRIAQAINLTKDQAEYLPVLPRRLCIFQSGDLPDPLLIEIPELIFDYVSEEEVKRHKEKTLPVLEYTPVKKTPAVDLDLDMNTFETQKPKERPNELWRRILNVVSKKAPVSFQEIYQDSGIDHWQGRKVLKTMENQDLIETCAVGFGARGNPKTFIVLKSKGAKFIGLDYEAVKLKGKGATEHVILQNLIAQALMESGNAGSVEVEHHINGKSCDIAVIRDDRSIAYEVELAPSIPHVAENIRLDLEAGFSQVVVITKNKACQDEAKNRISSEIDWENLSKVEFKLPKDFLKIPAKKKEA